MAGDAEDDFAVVGASGGEDFGGDGGTPGPSFTGDEIERLSQIEQLEAERDAYLSLAGHPGWYRLEAALKSDASAAYASLAHDCDPRDAAGVAALQARIRADETAIALPGLRAEALKAQIETLKKENRGGGPAYERRRGSIFSRKVQR